MSPLEVFATSLPSVGWILLAMAAIAAVEVAIPLRAIPRRPHLAPNLALTFLTFATSLGLNAALVVALAASSQRGWGLLHGVDLPPLAAGALSVAWLDFSFYLAHVLMHRLPGWWRFHRVHHSDAAVDVTTTLRQHPVEGAIRYAVVGAFALVLSPSLAAFGVYRAASALNGLLEHANVRLPARLDRALSLVTTWPNFHKVHHSRVRTQTDTNYGNLFSLWDRLFGTFTPSAEGASIAYGLEPFGAPQTTSGLLLSPWRADPVAPAPDPVDDSVSAPSRRRLV